MTRVVRVLRCSAVTGVVAAAAAAAAAAGGGCECEQRHQDGSTLRVAFVPGSHATSERSVL